MTIIFSDIFSSTQNIIFFENLSQLSGIFLLLSTSNFFSKISNKFRHDSQLFIDSKVEEYFLKITSFIEERQIWEYFSEYIKLSFDIEELAVIKSQYDITPYQTEIVHGYPEEKIKELLSEKNSIFLDSLEIEKKMIHRDNLEITDPLFNKMKQYGIDLAVPMIAQGEIIAILILGKIDDKRLTRDKFYILQLLSSQTAHVVDHIRTLQEKIQAQKLAEIGMLASQLAHDFQSFITLVKLDNSENERMKNYADYAEKLVQDLLNYARPQELNLTQINLNDLLEMCLDLVEISPDIKIEKQYAENLPEIFVDINQMRRAFTNLFENSLRAMENKSNNRLKLTTRVLRPSSKIQKNPWIYVEILDEGCGIPEDHMDNIFEPFFTTYKNRGGNGMGLAIVKQIITKHRGFIDVTSRPNKGTIFNIRLPQINH
jgi:signal transduction histidine kinase